jgi:hypothetical protein
VCALVLPHGAPGLGAHLRDCELAAAFDHGQPLGQG